MNLIFHAPQIVFLTMVAAGVAVLATKHGEERQDSYNGATTFVAVLLLNGIYFWGDFYKVVGVPQILMLVWGAFTTAYEMARHGEIKTGRYNLLYSLFMEAIVVSLLFWGGFFG